MGGSLKSHISFWHPFTKSLQIFFVKWFKKKLNGFEQLRSSAFHSRSQKCRGSSGRYFFICSKLTNLKKYPPPACRIFFFIDRRWGFFFRFVNFEWVIEYLPDEPRHFWDRLWKAEDLSCSNPSSFCSNYSWKKKLSNFVKVIFLKNWISVTRPWPIFEPSRSVMVGKPPNQAYRVMIRPS